MSKLKELSRCPWCGTDPLYVHYHDNVWGVPEFDSKALFAKLILDGAQAGLSWITILRRQEGYMAVFDNLDPDKVARYTDKKLEKILLDERIIRRMAQVNFLVVCSGNTCRSPMAEGILRRLLAERLDCREEELAERGYHVESAGTSAVDGMPVSPQAVLTLQARGIDISRHESRALRVEQINRADYILAMTAGHIETIRSLAPGAESRSRRIADEDIMDPIGGDDRVYVECAQRIEEALRRRLEEVPF